MDKDETNGGWIEWRMLIFAEIERHEDNIADHVVRISKVEMSVAKLNLIAAIFGAFGGIVAAGIVQLVLRGG